MDTQYISVKHSVLRFNLLLGFALLTSVAQASMESSDSLLPPTTTQILEQTVQKQSASVLLEQKENRSLSQSEIIDQATSQSADAHVITKNKDGSVRIPSPMQDVVATLTSNGASFQSVDNAKGDFALYVNSLGRDKGKLTKIKPGKVTNDEKVARLSRDNLIEEFTTSSGGIRQDFVVPGSPKGKGKLVVELDIKGATAKLDDKGAMLTLKSGRELAYHSLLVTDNAGQSLPAQFVLRDEHSLLIAVDDSNASYPVRIDPTITDADWFAMTTPFPRVEGGIAAMASDDSGNLYVAGGIGSIAGVSSSNDCGNYTGGCIAKWDGTSWSIIGTQVQGRVSSLLWAGNKLYAGGTFGSVNGISANNIAMWDGTSWSEQGGTGMSHLTFPNSVDVVALAWDGSNLYAGGYFTSAGGVSANHIAKWDGSSWSALGYGLDDAVFALAWDGSNLYAGGYFTSAGAAANTTCIAKWDGSSWSALGSGIGIGDVYTLAWDGSNLYAGGMFSSAGGVSANHIAKWDGNSWSALSTGTNNTVHALAWDGSNLYAFGEFNKAGGVSANHIAKWDGTSWSGTPYFPYVDYTNPFWALTFTNNHLYAGAQYFDILPTGSIRAWDGTSWTEPGTGIKGSDPADGIYTLTGDGANLYAGGDFELIDDTTTIKDIAKWDGNTWSGLGSGVSLPGAPYSNPQIYALAWDGASLYAGGDFTSAGSVEANHIAKWESNAWNALGTGMDNSVFALTWDGSNLYAGGGFSSAGGVVANRVAKWDSNAWSSLGSGMNRSVYALASDGANLYAGGWFTSAGGIVANHIAKWDGSAWSALGSGMDNIVSTLIWNGSNLYAGGDFTSAGGVAANYIAKWDSSAWNVLDTGMDNSVRALTWDGSNLYAGGWFTSAGGVAANYIAKWDGSVWSSLGSGMNGGVNALDWAGSTLYAGGDFTTAGDKLTGFIAGINMATPNPLTFTDITDASLNGIVTSEILDITGILTTVSVSVIGGEYSLNGAPFTSAAGTIVNGDTLQLRTTSSASYNTTVEVVVSVGDGSDIWSLTTLTDTVPTTFSFVDQTNVTPSTLTTSNTVVISDLGASAPVSINGGEYSINGGGFTSTDGFINNGDTVTLHTIASDERKTTVDVEVTIGGLSDVWSVTTHEGNSEHTGSINLLWLMLPFLVTVCRRRI